MPIATSCVKYTAHCTLYMTTLTDADNKVSAEQFRILSKEYAANGNYEKALHFAQKANRLYPCVESQAWIKDLEDKNSGNAESMNEQMGHGNNNINDNVSDNENERKNMKPTKRAEALSYTAEQVEHVKAFQRINKNDFYAVLRVEMSAHVDDIKKSYRKMALLYHPDKNHAPGADEAFKGKTDISSYVYM